MTIAAAAVSVALAAPTLAGSAPRQDPRAEREQVRAERAAVAAKIDTTKATLAEVDDALQALEENVRSQRSALAKAEAAVAQATKDRDDAQRAITRLHEQLKVLRGEMRERAVRAYVSPSGDNVFAVLGTKDFTSAAERSFYVGLQSQTDADVADRLDGATTDLAFQKRKAAAAKERADAQRAEQAKRTKAVEKAEAQQQALSDKLQATVDSQISRSLQLAKTDRALSAKIAEQQAALVARIAAQKAANQRASAKAAAAAAAEAAAANRAANVGTDGREHGPSTSSSSSSGGGGGGGTATVEPGPVDSGIQLAYVQGIPVNAQVADQVTAMINAAAADGVSLRIGNSYRPVSQQIELRKQNCGTSYYAIYEMSSGSCHPPTAKPGQSQHQLGLAIDFQSCSSHGTACYRWLSGHGSQYGYYNLPSEAWHWSTTGK
ncbi:D-alanyl-D-alanine carboxypeptidase family protein [Aquihabitans sp. G128]|uniref:D-alanyl-D-alanine carboxypeptidase family protein n=1 Tax=Aquihabitans sp. G128 TaxID=2849779 RepID=UPI001C211DAA|nr:D-alanyl-D-alanine carboxypeptidase family protein [Aquihabitans sp. G128]QXC62752.1 D-alanyl-D-alanine carboxypeptidase family protein [Aquihabitans sp. G128]